MVLVTTSYTTVQEFLQAYGFYASILQFQSGVKPSWETVVIYDQAVNQYILANLGVVSATLNLRTGTAHTAMILTTDYTFDSSTSIITLTAAGVTKLGVETLQANYGYSTLGSDADETYISTLLLSAETDINQETNVVFADQTATNPAYRQINDELTAGKGFTSKVYQTQLYPVVKLQTTTNGNYTTGGTTITLTSAAGFPNAATINIGNNKVTYTAKSGNVLTVPSTTPTIATASVVRGEVIEVSFDFGGLPPSYTLMVPDTNYSIDYDTGYIEIWQDFYFTSVLGNIVPPDGVFDRVKLTYLQGWHDVDSICTVPTSIVRLAYDLAARKMAARTVRKAQISGRSNFAPELFEVDTSDMERIISDYKAYKMTRV